MIVNPFINEFRLVHSAGTGPASLINEPLLRGMELFMQQKRADVTTWRRRMLGGTLHNGTYYEIRFSNYVA
jgi:hypothetical protein